MGFAVICQETSKSRLARADAPDQRDGLARFDPQTFDVDDRSPAGIGEAAIFVHTDVTKEKSVESLMNAAVERFGSLNILFNCAGGSVVGDTLVTEVDMDVWEHTIPLDLRGPFLCSRFGIPKLSFRKRQ